MDVVKERERESATYSVPAIFATDVLPEGKSNAGTSFDFTSIRGCVKTREVVGRGGISRALGGSKSGWCVRESEPSGSDVEFGGVDRRHNLGEKGDEDGDGLHVAEDWRHGNKVSRCVWE